MGYDISLHYRDCVDATQAMLEGVTPLVESGYLDDAEVVVIAFGTPARYVRAAVRDMRQDGIPVGFVRPITLVPFPGAAIAAAAGKARAVAVYENNQGQMVDDVRLAVLGQAPVHFIGRLSLDSSGFGIAPDLDVAVIRTRIDQVVRSVKEADVSTTPDGRLAVRTDVPPDSGAAPGRRLHSGSDRSGDPPVVPRLRRTRSHEIGGRDHRRAGVGAEGHCRVRDRLLHRLLQQPRCGGASSVARTRPFSGHRSQALPARLDRVHGSR